MTDPKPETEQVVVRMVDDPSDPRHIIDPGDLFPADGGMRYVEKHALEVLSLIPDATFERTRDVFQISSRCDAEDGIILILTPEALELRMPMTEWVHNPYGAAESSHLWKRVTWEKACAREGGVEGLIDAARRARRRQFFTCPYCKCRVERGSSVAGVCYGCAYEHRGIVF